MKDRSRFASRTLFALTLAIVGAVASGQVGPAWTWTRTANDAANDSAAFIQVDSDGNSFAAGANAINIDTNPVQYAVLAKVGPDGAQKWVKTLADPDGTTSVVFSYDVLDGQGNVFVSGYDGNDFLTAKYDGNGNLLWKKTYTSTSAGFRVVPMSAIASDGSGGVYVDGVAFPPGGGYNWVICHYDANGNLKFSYEMPQSGFFRIAVDPQGNLVAVGTSEVVLGTGPPEGLILKLDPNGNTLFQAFAGQGFAQSILVDASGDIYTSLTNDDSKSSTSALVEYGPTGSQILSPQLLSDQAEIKDLKLDSQGNIIASGLYNNTTSSFPSIGVWKMTNTGQKIWRQSWDYPADAVSSDRLHIYCAVDSADNVYLTDNYTTAIESFESDHAAILKVGSLGNKLWPDSGGSFLSGALVIPNFYSGNVIPISSSAVLMGGTTYYPDFTGRMQVINFAAQQVSGLTILPNIQWSGVATAGTVTLGSPAPVGGTVVGLAGSANVTVPATVTILAGQTSAQFPVKGINVSYAITTGTVTATLGSSVLPANFSIKPADFAEFGQQTIPTSMIAGQKYPVDVQYVNRGGVVWTSVQGFKLQSQGPTDNMTWGINRLPLTNGPVSASMGGVFDGTVTAPATPGTYPMSWSPIEEGVTSFGTVSPVVNVKVVAVGVDSAALRVLTCPSSVQAGNDFNGSTLYINTGSTTWTTAAGYRMVAINPLMNTIWGPSSMPLMDKVVYPGSQCNFSGRYTAPMTPGAYTFAWSIEHGTTLFGPVATTTIQVVPASYNAKFMGENVPTWVGPGTSFVAALVYKNVGTSTWGLPGANVGIKSENPAANLNWGTSFVDIVGTTAPGANAVISHTFTAPSSPGVYQFEWRATFMGGESFGEYSRPVSIIVASDASRFISRAGITATTVGANFTVTYTMRNTGTTTWTAAGGYELVSQDPLNNTIWGLNHVVVPASVAPGAQIVISVPCKAPTSSGSFAMQFQMAKGGVPFGEKSGIVSVTVLATP